MTLTPLLCKLQAPPMLHHLPSLPPNFSSQKPIFGLATLTKPSCISLLKLCSSMRKFKQIHCQILISNQHRTREILDHLILYCTHPQTGDLKYALKLFETIKTPSLFAYNLMIKAFHKKGSFNSVLMLYNRMREESLKPDNFTYPLVLKSMGRLGLTEEARKVHAFVLKSGFEVDSYVRSSLIGVFADLDCVEIARLLFDEMPERSLVCWNALISGLVKCREFEGAISVFEKMEEEGLEPDEATLVSTLSACVQLRNLELSKKIHRYINESFKFSTPIGNVLLDLYAKCGCLDLARTYFDGMLMKNVISWTNMISGYLNLGRLHEARELFDSCPTKDIILWTTMLNGYVQYNQYKEALSLFQMMSMKRIKLDKFTVVTLLTACANLGALEQGEWIHEYIKNNMIQADAVVSTALIEMYSKCGCIEKSMEVFENVQGRKDAKSWTSIVCALAMNGQAARALEMFSAMQMYGAKPDDITFIGVLAACSHGGLLDEGRRYFYEMKEIHRVEPRIEHYGCFIDLLGRFGLLEEAAELIERMSNVKDCDVLSLWGSLLGSCRIHGNAEMGERIVKKVVDYESRDSGLYVSIANLYAAAERWEDVHRVRGKMKDTGVKKTPGCSSVTSHSDIPVLNSMNRVMEMKEMEEVDKGLMEAVS